MINPKILIAGSAYIDNEGLRELCKLWTRVVSYLDPHTDVVIIDSCSPYEPGAFLKWPVQADESNDGILGGQWIYRFPDNIGHLSRGGEDGAGRTFCKSMELAIVGQYDYVAVIETDLIFLRSVSEVVNRMHRNGIKAAALSNPQYNFPEFGATFFDVKWLKDFGLVEKYNWKHSQPWPIPEIRIMNLLEDYLMLFPLYGMRNDQNALTEHNMANMFPYGPIAWLTHCRDFSLYLRAITLNNIRLS